MNRLAALAFAALAAATASFSPDAAGAEDLYHPNSFSAMASDRRANQIGDSLTIIINETSSASNSNKTSSAKSTTLQGQAVLGSKSHILQLGSTGAFDGSAETTHAGKMLAQLSVVVEQVLPNGDLRVSGYH